MQFGYTRVSKSDGSQQLDLQTDAMVKAGVDKQRIFCDQASGSNDTRPGLDSVLKALRSGDVLVVWKLDRLGRSLRHLVDTVHTLSDRGIGLKVLTGFVDMDTSTAQGKLVFSIFAALAEFERELISERTKAGLEAARKRGRKGGRKYSLTPAKIRLAQAALMDSGTDIASLCKELGVSRSTLYRYMDASGDLRDAGKKVMAKAGQHGIDQAVTV